MNGIDKLKKYSKRVRIKLDAIKNEIEYFEDKVSIKFLNDLKNLELEFQDIESFVKTSSGIGTMDTNKVMKDVNRILRDNPEEGQKLVKGLLSPKSKSVENLAMCFSVQEGIGSGCKSCYAELACELLRKHMNEREK